jgi:hypothetical protein
LISPKQKRAPALPQRVESLEQFIQAARQLEKAWARGEPTLPWFRGQENAEWGLLPKIYRYPDMGLSDEYEIREQFCTLAPVLSNGTPVTEQPDAANWAWYFLMQHYGVPTRLLDWTESALVALYFAVRGNDGSTPAAVWALDPWTLNRRLLRTDAVIPPGDPGILESDRRRVAKWLPYRFAHRRRLPRFPVAVYPTHTAVRISAQKSCFTVHGQERLGFEILAKDALRRCIVKVEIPAWSTREIRDALETCGLEETSVFPDLEALGRSLTLGCEPAPRLPHEQVSVRLGKSERHGVGAFAIRRIRKGSRVFSNDPGGVVWIPEDEVKRLPAATRKLYEDFAVLKNGRYGAPVHFERLTPAWYVNDDRKGPNLRADEYLNFFALRDIVAGEELTADYSTYSENEYTEADKQRLKGNRRIRKRSK